MNQTALVFGPAQSNIGIVADPPPGVARRDVGVIILNAGILHRVGPARIHVTLARALQELGFTSLRFDFSGIGDSPKRSATGSFADAAVAEARAAMTSLSSLRGIERFLVVGICSGADVTVQAARADDRVVGAAVIDGFNILTPLFVLLQARRQIFKPRSWWRLVSGRSLTLRAMRHTVMSQESVQTSIIPSYADFVAGVRALTSRGTDVFMLFTGRSPAFFRYSTAPRWRVRSWPSRGRLRVHHLRDTDHTFTLVKNQQLVVRLLTEWAVQAAGIARQNAPAAAVALEAPRAKERHEARAGRA